MFRVMLNMFSWQVLASFQGKFEHEGVPKSIELRLLMAVRGIGLEFTEIWRSFLKGQVSHAFNRCNWAVGIGCLMVCRFDILIRP